MLVGEALKVNLITTEIKLVKKKTHPEIETQGKINFSSHNFIRFQSNKLIDD